MDNLASRDNGLLISATDRPATGDHRPIIQWLQVWLQLRKAPSLRRCETNAEGFLGKFDDQMLRMMIRMMTSNCNREALVR